MISDRKQYIGIKNNIVFELFQFLFMLEWFLACISRFSAHIPTSFSVFMPNICCLDKLDNKHYAYRLIMMWEYGQKNEKYWPGSIPAHIRIGKVLNVVIFDTNNCLFPIGRVKKMIVGWLRKIVSFTKKILFDCYSFEKQCNNANPWVFLLYNFFERIFFSKSDVYLDKKGIKIILLKMNLYLINVTSHLLKQL